jgi:dihydrolipoamide dehydrogenase
VQVEAGILATGSRPAIPMIPGVGEEQVVTPHTLGQLQDLPSRLAIIGGGIIAAEFSYIFSTFGSEVTVLSRSGFLKTLNPVLQKAARKALQGVVLKENTPVQEIQKIDTGLSLLLEGEEVLEADAVLLATGLVPNSECAVGLKKGALGEIVVDDRMRTSAPGIYACGDVTGPPYLTPVARMEGMVAADNILGRDRRVDYRFLPQSITLEYDLLFCGGEGGQLAAVASPSPSGHESFWSVPSGNTGVSRVLVERESGRLSGVEIAAPGASLLGAYLAFLMRQGCTVQDLEGILEVHPSTDGIIPLLRYMAEWKRKQQSE